MTTHELLTYLARLEKYRASLYLSPDKIEHWYLQKVSQIMELGTGEQLSGKLEASLWGVLRSEVGGDKVTESKVAIDNEIVQGVVVENVARASKTLIDLSLYEPKKGELCYYLGAARITLMNVLISPENTSLDAAESSTVSAIRKDQEAILEAFDPNTGTIVLTFKANHRTFASIGSLKSVKSNWLSSYHNAERFGILCTLERTFGEVAFLDPLWIWHE